MDKGATQMNAKQLETLRRIAEHGLTHPVPVHSNTANALVRRGYLNRSWKVTEEGRKALAS